jgi:dihydroneopterin aldolase
MSDQWFLQVRDVRVGSVIGVYDWEQAIAQQLSVSVIIELTDAPTNDNWLNYETLITTIRDCAAARPRKLIEELATEVADELWDSTRQISLRVAIKKNVVVDGQAASPEIVIERR